MMLAYRFVSYFQPELTGFVEFKDVFSDSEQKGIDSLVQTLAKIDSGWLKLILTTPLIIGFLKGIWSARGVSDITAQWMKVSDVTLKKIDAKNITARNVKISEIKSSVGGVKVQGMSARGITSSEITMDEEKLTANEITASNMEAKALSSGIGTIEEMTIVEMTNKGQRTTAGIEMKEVIAETVTAKEVKLAGSGFTATDLSAKQMKIDEMTGTVIRMEASELRKTAFAVDKHIGE